MGGHPRQVCSRVGGRGRHRPLRCRDVAVRARRRVRAVPDLRQRALALRTASGGHRSRLSCHVRRPNARSKDAAVTPLRPLAALAMVALIGAGCSGNGSSGGSKNATDREKAMKFAECMRENGVSAFPDPERVGRVDHRWDSQRLVAGHEHRGVQEGHRRVQGPGARGVHGPQEERPGAAEWPRVRPVHARQRSEGLPGPHQRWAPHRHESNPICRREGCPAAFRGSRPRWRSAASHWQAH